jgi:hypothetical protein
MSPGYFTRGKNSGYVPQAYPQIASALETLAINLPEEVNLSVEKGYVLIVDPIPLAVKALLVYAFAGALGGFLGYVSYWDIFTSCDINKWSWREGAALTVSGALMGVGSALGVWILTGKWPLPA